MSTADTKVKLKPVRLDLTPYVHRLLRMAAARSGVSMSEFLRREVEHIVCDMVRNGDINP